MTTFGTDKTRRNRIRTSNRSYLIGAVAVTVLLISAGCGGSDSSEATSTPAPTVTTESASPAQDGAEHNNADVMFARQMIPHHQQAIQMSDIVLAKEGIDPRVTTLADQIKAAQGPEITQLEGWLDQWGKAPMPSMPPAGTPGHGDTPDHGDLQGPGDTPDMAGGHGMMSAQDISALEAAQGVNATKLFLQQMIAHHEGAISMSEMEVRDGKYPPEVEMARSIITSQQQEIEEMKAILGSL